MRPFFIYRVSFKKERLLLLPLGKLVSKSHSQLFRTFVSIMRCSYAAPAAAAEKAYRSYSFFKQFKIYLLADLTFFYFFIH